MIASVVVPTFRRPGLLRRCLAALLEQDLDPCAFEIIVADDGASEDVRSLVEELARQTPGHPHLRYIPVHDTEGPAAARNRGWRVASGAIIAFTDDDCIPTPGWLRAGIAAFRPGVAGVSGKIVMPIPDPPTDYELNAARLADARFVTANCFYRRDALAAAGGFDERFRAAWREDADLAFTLMTAGYTLERCEDAVVVHPVRPAPWGVSIGQQRKSMYNALLFRKHPELYRAEIQPSPPWRYYAILAALLGTGAGLLTGRHRAARLAGLVWLTLTGRFCMQRLAGTSRSPRHIAEMAVTSACIPPLSIYWRLRGALKFRVIFW